MGCVLSVALCGAAEAGEIANSSAATLDLAALQPLVPLDSTAVLSSAEIAALGKQDKLDIMPASASADPIRPEPTNSPAANFINGIEYNLQHIDVSQYGDYSIETFWDQAKSVKWDILALYGGITVFGINNWDWGSSGYHFQNEGWFGTDTKYGGMDKLGHAYTGYVVSQYFTQRIAHSVDDPTNAAITGALLGMGFQTYIEFFDGFAGEHGFSYEDLIADGVGATFSFLRNTVPGLADKVDYRLEYWGASEYHEWGPATDYDGQRYFWPSSSRASTSSRIRRCASSSCRRATTPKAIRTRPARPGRRSDAQSLCGDRPEPERTPGRGAGSCRHPAGPCREHAFTYWQPPYTYVVVLLPQLRPAATAFSAVPRLCYRLKATQGVSPMLRISVSTARQGQDARRAAAHAMERAQVAALRRQ